MIKDPNRLVEGIESFIGGANSSVDPALLPPNQFSWGENISIRGGYPRSRPGFKFIKAIPNGVIQGASYFKNPSVDELVTLINGRLYSVQPADATAPVLDVTPAAPAGETNNYISRQASFASANNFLVVQDGVSSPIVYTGSTSYRSERILEEISSYVELQVTMGANNPRINVSSTAGLFPGMLIQAARGVPPNTVIVSVDTATEVTLNKNCTLTALATVKFFPPGPLQANVSIPVGTVMAFGNGRLWVARGNQLFAGDLAGSYAGAEVRFSEIQYISGGGSFAFDSDITGLAFLPGSDTSTGQGDLIVFTREQVGAIRSNVFDRALWQQTQGMQRRIFVGGGAESPDSMVVTNNDVYFRSLDGVRSFVQTVQFTKSANVTLVDSIEADRVINYDTQRWIRFSPAVYFDYRALYGCAPKIQKVSGDPTAFNIVFTKLVSQDFNPGVYQGNFPPVYDGEWTGLQVCKLVQGVFDGDKRCFAIVCGSDGNNALYEITTDDYFDTIPYTQEQTAPSIKSLLSEGIDNSIIGVTANDASQLMFSTANPNNGVSPVYTRSATCWAQNIDTSPTSVWTDGNGADPRYNANMMTLISPRHGVVANHWIANIPGQNWANYIGAKFIFVAMDNTCYIRTFTASAQVPGDFGGTDIRVVLLDSDLPPNISFCKIASFSLASAASTSNRIPAMFQSYFPSDRPPGLRAAIADYYTETGNVGAGGAGFVYPPADEPRASFYVPPFVGDSGRPTCFVYDNKLILLVTFLTPATGPNLPYYIENINTVMTTLGGGYTVTVFNESDLPPAPEPITTMIPMPISSSVEFRRMSFESPFEIKELVRADLSFSEIYGDVSWNFEFAPDYYPTFLPIQTGTVSYETQTDSFTTCAPLDLALGYYNVRTVKPSDSCVTGVGRKARFGYLFQPKMSWVGHAKLALFRLHASRKDISDLGEC